MLSTGAGLAASTFAAGAAGASTLATGGASAGLAATGLLSTGAGFGFHHGRFGDHWRRCSRCGFHLTEPGFLATGFSATTSALAGAKVQKPPGTRRLLAGSPAFAVDSTVGAATGAAAGVVATTGAGVGSTGLALTVTGSTLTAAGFSLTTWAGGLGGVTTGGGVGDIGHRTNRGFRCRTDHAGQSAEAAQSARQRVAAWFQPQVAAAGLPHAALLDASDYRLSPVDESRSPDALCTVLS